MRVVKKKKVEKVRWIGRNRGLEVDISNFDKKPEMEKPLVSRKNRGMLC